MKKLGQKYLNGLLVVTQLNKVNHFLPLSPGFPPWLLLLSFFQRPSSSICALKDNFLGSVFGSPLFPIYIISLVTPTTFKASVLRIFQWFPNVNLHLGPYFWGQIYIFHCILGVSMWMSHGYNILNKPFVNGGDSVQCEGSSLHQWCMLPLISII